VGAPALGRCPKELLVPEGRGEKTLKVIRNRNRIELGESGIEYEPANGAADAVEAREALRRSVE
jgi:hypothetical protein